MNKDKKIILVTGAKKGIGKATVKKFSDNNYVVIATDKDFKEEKTINNIHYYKMDVTNRKSIIRVVENVERKIGYINFLACVAGVFDSISLEEITLDDWNKILGVNTIGVFNVIQIVGQMMTKQRSGNIIVVSSNASKFPRKNMSVYSASKAAITMFTKCVALEFAEVGIRCNIVSPGSTNTDMQRKLWNGENNVPKEILEGDINSYRLGIPLKKIAEPEDVAESIFYLASDKANHITMEDLTIDGGATMGV
ncbi:MAG: 2,3-dihydro-2,3-dihydroxybenzoate dehydrogenase [Peptostreptococcus sp.]|uniref:2,3-dihydro-2,3-dihydroxybenzoate dehydrogenase n=1 Tax=Peptostreptococcus sp. TaxID=1262 RepID=UPI000763CCE6|nr:2,3-dihydro-2,3-dihydroxybenzoate dehydrogenase [Peptostreptococcus sp.]MDU5350756.1 2,3-dihydro-2,3-dihydroxybenzoate dehydrogenase [Peptostreptococcus sp.]MDU5890376.1 2,3-dihydro-2,3-dihydroxybenzoate dehydrogenase [Peptostreptococcus sp.]MDU6063816.1 2,3-dihydro-2,3-dihydroxybenzoate dehydrogenase [Anaerococcus sp.]